MLRQRLCSEFADALDCLETVGAITTIADDLYVDRERPSESAVVQIIR